MMSALRPFIFPIILLSLAACSAGTSNLPLSSDAVSRGTPTHRPPLPATAGADPASGFNAAREAFRNGDAAAALLLAQGVIERGRGTPWYKRALFLTQRALIRLDRPAEAESAMLRVTAEYPELADYAVSLLADYHFEQRRYSRAAELYQNLRDRYPKSSLIANTAFRRASALLESYAYLPAAEGFEEFLQDNPRAESAPLAGMGLARSLIAEARLDEAVRAYRDVWVQYPGAATDQDVEKALAELAASGVEVAEPTPEELNERGRNLARSNQHAKALETFAKLLDQKPESPYRPEALFRSGVAAFYLGRRGEAAVVLEKMIRDYPSDPKAPEALHWLGKAYGRLGDWEKGIRSFQKILDRYPDSEWADDALFLSGNIWREAGDLKRALTYYEKLSRKYPDSRFADSSIWWRAWSLYLAGDYQKTEQILQELINRYPRSFLVNQARYWQGRAAEQRGNRPRAAAYYERVRKKSPYTYYGTLAAERVAAWGEAVTVPANDIPADTVPSCGEQQCVDPESPLTETDEGPPVWTEETKQLLAAQPSYQKTLELMHLDMKKEAAAELWFLRERMPRKRGALIGLSKAFFELGDYHHALLLVLRNYERYLEGPVNGTPEDLWLLAYPRGYWESIQSYARKYGQDPYFVAAIIRQESQFNVEALSPAGARGLMQVMPTTGEWVARSLKLPEFDEKKLFESDTIINIGTWYIGHLMKRFKGDHLLVAAAYNAGPDAVAGWITRNGYGKDRDAFVESIPYKETRGYVKKVLRNYGEYRRIYGRNADAASAVRISGAGFGSGSAD
ncbi:MAG TPA: tetratricopeptide repeat protein [Nitrospirota bacterium]